MSFSFFEEKHLLFREKSNIRKQNFALYLSSSRLHVLNEIFSHVLFKTTI